MVWWRRDDTLEELRRVIERVGNYKILDELGSGGMAVVYKGIQESLGRHVAIKALRTSVASEPDAVARFDREASHLASFQHENIITVYDFFPKGGTHFIVMEYVDGIDLYDLLERCGRLPGDIASIVSLHVARALDYAHFRGVIHRDVKPANIIVSKLGSVKLTDFGIIQVEQSDLTRTGVGLGTPAYMSPEQVLGRRLDQRSDIFSLGIVMYQMVTGQKPFVEDPGQTILEKVRGFTPPPPRAVEPSVPRELETIILRCMDKDPAGRFATSQELVVNLEQYLSFHVNLNYRARMLLFLQREGVLTAEEARATLHPAMIGEYMGRVPLLRVGRGAGGRGLVLGALAGMALLAALVLALALGRGGETAPKPIAGALPAPGAPVVAARAAPGVARLRVVVHPWARVEVNGQVLATTPLDRPLSLPPGTYRVKLVNPYFHPEEHTVKLAAGRQSTLTVALSKPAARAP